MRELGKEGRTEGAMAKERVKESVDRVGTTCRQLLLECEPRAVEASPECLVHEKESDRSSTPLL